MPTRGSAGMTTPAWAPSTPASQEPSVDATLPFAYSRVLSPRYQTFPARSWAYQSYVFSTSAPPWVTTSWTTLALTPATRFVRCVTVTSTRFSVPSGSVSRYTHLLPGAIGQYGLPMRVVNSAGSSSTRSSPRGRADGPPSPSPSPPPQPMAARTTRATVSGPTSGSILAQRSSEVSLSSSDVSLSPSEPTTLKS